MLNSRVILVALLVGVAHLANVALPTPTYAQSGDSTFVWDAVETISAGDIGVDRGDAGRNIGGRLLFGRARYHAGDDVAWADPDFDDQNWEVASVGLRSDVFPQQGWPGVGWFRITLRVDASLHDADLGFVITHSGAIEAYLDGNLVYQSGTVGTTPADEEPYEDLDPFVLPIEAGNEYVLALRYSSFVTEGFRADWFYTGPGVYWGDRATMTYHRGFIRFNQGFFSAFFLAFTLLFGLLYGLYRSERLFLYLSFSYGILVPYIFIGTQLSFIHSPALTMPLLDVAFAFAASALLVELLVVYAFFYQDRPRQFYAFLFLGFAAIVAFAWRLENAVYFFLFLVLISLELLRVIFEALRQRKPWAWIVAVGVVPGVLIQFWEVLENLGYVSAPWTGTPFNPGMISILFFSSAFAVYVGIRFAEARKGLAELEAARQLQLSMLPEMIPEHPVVELAASMQTASQVGGDYYDFDIAEDGALTIAIGDATGHGTKAGIMVTATRSLWNAFSSEEDLTVVLHRCNAALKRMALPQLYMALALARLRDRTLELVGAGLPPALVYRVATREVEIVTLKGMPLGGPGQAHYQTQLVELSPGDAVVLMTDGFPERFNTNGEMLGYDRAVSEFTDVAGESPENIIAQLMSRCESWAAGRDQDDDVTFVVMKMKTSSVPPDTAEL